MYSNSPRAKKRKRMRKYTRASERFEDVNGRSTSESTSDEEEDENPVKRSAKSENDATGQNIYVRSAERLNSGSDDTDSDSESDMPEIGPISSEDESDSTTSEDENSEDDELQQITDPAQSDSDMNIETAPGAETEIEDIAEGEKKSKAKRIRTNMLKEWLPWRTSYLKEMLRHEGDVGIENKCPFCNVGGDNSINGTSPSYTPIKCDECVGYRPRCASCVIEDHHYNPFHCIKIFNGSYWEKANLRDVGFVLNATHDGLPCPDPSRPFDVTVLDIDNIQTVSISLCGCVKSYDEGGSQKSQFLRHSLYPATVKQPKTVATLRMLKLFHQLTHQSKLSAYDFYHTLVKNSEYTSSRSETQPKRYDEFLRIIRQYRNLQMLKRGGKGLSVETIPETSNGELALECPACPHPGRNLQDNWEKEDDGWKHAQFLMLDANFRLKSKAGKARDDPELAPGWSYFVEDSAYKEHLANVLGEKEIRYCDSGLRAVDHANLRGSNVYEASGVVAVQCRHMMIRKNGVGDLQKGEKFTNVNYVLLSTLKAVKVKKIVLSYDINCQYSRNFHKRVEKYKPELSGDISRFTFDSVIPKFHLPGHGESCQSNYSLNYKKHVGRTDGENIERGWATLNAVSMSTKEMGKGSRHDTLDDQMFNFCWDRFNNLGKILKKNVVEAIKEEKRHTIAHDEFSAAFPADTLIVLRKKIAAWEEDPQHNPDPFRDSYTKTTYNEVKRLLSELEAKEKGIQSEGREDLTAARWLAIGIELDENQTKLKELYGNLKESKAKALKAQAEEKNTLMLLQIRAWLEAQRDFMPGLKAVELDDILTFYDSGPAVFTKGHGAIPKAHSIKLLLPSKLEKQVRDIVCAPGLIEKEIELRKAQAEDALYDIRKTLRKGFTLVHRKDKHVKGSGQKNNTRMGLALENVRTKREDLGERYKKAIFALDILDPDGKWKLRYNDLKPEHLVPLSGKEQTGTGQGRFINSWIWTMDRITIDNTEGEVRQEMDEGLCIEWARSYARLERWREEIILVKEEMRRVLAYLRWKANEWIEKAERFVGVEDKNGYNRGRIAHANRQASILRGISKKYEKEWKGHLLVTGTENERKKDLLILRTL